MADLISVNHNIPKSIISELDIQKAVDEATRKGAERVVKILQKTVSTWDEPPNFSIKKTATGYEVTYDARSRGGKHFEWVNEGTKAHTITAKGSKPMRFQWAGRGNYPTKSHRGSLNAYVGINSKRGIKGMAWVRAYQINHPGSWPRDFTGLIMKDEKDRILKDVVKLVGKLPKHGMYGPRLER